MGTHLAFLRAINLGARRRVSMDDLRDCLERAGLDDVATHLATGNVRFGTSLRSIPRIEATVEAAVADRVGFEVPTMVRTPAALRAAYAAAAALEGEAERRYVTFFKEPLSPEHAAEVDAWDAPGEGARCLGAEVHWWIDHPSRAARLSNQRLERYGVATTRDLKVVRTLVERWCG